MKTLQKISEKKEGHKKCAMCGSELTGDREKRIGLCESCICAEEMPECILGECRC